MASQGAESEGSMAIEMANLNSALIASVRQKLDGLPPISPGYCIYRAPQCVRQLNEKAYTPQKFSIGPLHHGKQHLLPMEEQKLRYLSSFLDRTTLSLEDCVGFIRQQEQRVRDCYVESFDLPSDEFVKIILVDSCFIIEVIWRSYNFSDREEFDYLSNCISLSDLVRTDMILLENQIPFFIMAGLFDLAFPPETEESFAELSVRFFRFASLLDNVIGDFTEEKYSNLGQEAKHFVDLLRLCHLPSVRRSHLPAFVKYATIPTARELQEVGISIRKGWSKNLLDIQYANGVLTIPQLDLDDDSEIALRNFIAYEMCHCMHDSYIIDYVIFMDTLIDTTHDVDILVQNGVFENSLLDRTLVANFFHSLTLQVLWTPGHYYYKDSCRKINEYCKVPWHRWKAIMKRDYFSTPWRALATFGAVILLVLTLIQTICTIIQTLHV